LELHLRKHSIKLALHDLDALETVCVGVLVRKHQEVTHLKPFSEYLKQQVITSDALGFEFEIKRSYLKIQSGFGEVTKTSMVGFYTGIEHVAILERLLADNFPLNSEGQEFFISFRARIDDDRMKKLYEIHNNWVKAVAVVPVGGYQNIDTQYNLGFDTPMSLREFIRNQPERTGGENIPMDNENGSNNGKLCIIVKQDYMQEAKSILASF